jgi:WD40 repeat protein
MFSNDGHRVLTRSADGTAKIWHARSGQLLASIDAHGGGLTAAVFVNNGNHVLTGGQDGVAVLHEATHAGMVQLACDRLRHQVEWTAVKDACPSSATASTVRPASTR